MFNRRTRNGDWCTPVLINNIASRIDVAAQNGFNENFRIVWSEDSYGTVKFRAGVWRGSSGYQPAPIWINNAPTVITIRGMDPQAIFWSQNSCNIAAIYDREMLHDYYLMFYRWGCRNDDASDVDDGEIGDI